MKNALKGLRPVNFIMLTIAGIINAIGVTLFLNPVELLDGGLSGLSLLLDRITPHYLTLSIFVVVLNFPFYLFANKKIGLHFTIYSLYAITIYSISAFVLKDVINFDFSNGSPIAKNELLLCAIFGGLLSGIGSGITIRFGGALDGVEVMAVLFAKRIGMTVGIFVMSFNVVLYTVQAIIFKDAILAMYSIIAYFVGIKTVDLLVEGLDKAKSVMIVTDTPDELCSALSVDFGRGLTILDAKGYYSNSNKKMIYCVVNRFEIPKLKKIVTQVDSKAFVAINDTSDTMGRLKFRLRK